VEYCWYAVIDTCGDTLSFDQDLIFSKYLNDKPEIDPEAKFSETFRDDSEHVIGDFMLLGREICNRIITSTSLTVL